VLSFDDRCEFCFAECKPRLAILLTLALCAACLPAAASETPEASASAGEISDVAAFTGRTVLQVADLLDPEVFDPDGTLRLREQTFTLDAAAVATAGVCDPLPADGHSGALAAANAFADFFRYRQVSM
jgi:hypothetical protein